MGHVSREFISNSCPVQLPSVAEPQVNGMQKFQSRVGHLWIVTCNMRQSHQTSPGAKRHSVNFFTDQIMYYQKSKRPLRGPTSSWRPFGPLHFVLRALLALRPVRRARLRSGSPFLTIFDHFETILDHFRPYGPFWTILDHFRPFQTILTIFGNFRPFLAIFTIYHHFAPF